MLVEPKLAPEQIAAYRRDGFVVVRNAFDPQAMATIAGRGSELAARPEESGRH